MFGAEDIAGQTDAIGQTYLANYRRAQSCCQGDLSLKYFLNYLLARRAFIMTATSIAS